MFTDIVGASRISQVSTRPPPVEYDSGTSLRPGDPGVGGVCSLSGGELICSRSGTLLPDNNRGAQNFTPSDGWAWNRDVTLIIAIQATLVTGVNLFFYNFPSMGVGLPHEIELTWGSTTLDANNKLEHVILGNQDLSLNDTGLRNVTVVATSNGATSYGSIGLHFRFSSNENNIRWLLLTEIELCNEGTCTCITNYVVDVGFSLQSLSSCLRGSLNYRGHTCSIRVYVEGRAYFIFFTLSCCSHLYSYRKSNSHHKSR